MRKTKLNDEGHIIQTLLSSQHCSRCSPYMNSFILTAALAVRCSCPLFEDRKTKRLTAQNHRTSKWWVRICTQMVGSKAWGLCHTSHCLPTQTTDFKISYRSLQTCRDPCPPPRTAWGCVVLGNPSAKCSVICLRRVGLYSGCKKQKKGRPVPPKRCSCFHLLSTDSTGSGVKPKKLLWNVNPPTMLRICQAGRLCQHHRHGSQDGSQTEMDSTAVTPRKLFCRISVSFLFFL